MKIIIKFKHHKKAQQEYFSPATFFMGKDCSTGPVFGRGKSVLIPIEVKSGDVIEYATTKFSDEIDFKIYRNRKLLNYAKF